MKDSEIIRPETLHFYCNTNEALLTGKPHAIVLEVTGLGGGSCLGGTSHRKPYETEYAKRLAENGIVLAFVFTGPWTYMNRAAVKICDLVVDCLRAKWEMDENCPLIMTGGSMGGLGALIYAADTRHTLRAVVSCCPCYDAVYYFELSPDRARAMLTSVAGYDMPIMDAIATISPAHRLNEMPHLPYFIACDGADNLFDADGMERFAIDLDAATGGQVSFRRMEGIGHGGFIPEVREEITEFVIRYATL